LAPSAGSLEELITHGLHALRETLQQDKELTPLNTSIGIVGPAGAHEKRVPPSGAFRILEGEPIDVYLQRMVPKEAPAGSAAAANATAGTAPTPAAGDEDVQMQE
jgi:20S proteasome subunit alpha 6